MPAYVGLVKLTEQGIRDGKDTTKRAKSFREGAEKSGVQVKETLWTMGRYDVVPVIDAPNDETMSRLALGLKMLGESQDGDTQGLFASGDGPDHQGASVEEKKTRKTARNGV
jgi:uncharacterized protein with GYD domain